MKKLVFSMCAAALVLNMSASAFALEEIDFTLRGDFYSKYIWRGQNLLDGPAFQPSISAGAYGFTGSVWGSLDLTDKNDNRGEFTEVDYSLDYTAKLIEGVNLSVGTIYYDFPNTNFSSTTELYSGLSFDLPLSPSVTVFRDIDEIEGTYVKFGLGHTIEKLSTFSEECYCDLVLGASLGYGTSSYNDGYFGTDDGAFNDLTLSLSLPVCLPGEWTLSPSISYVTLLDSDIKESDAYDRDSDHVITGISLSKSF